MGHLTEAQIKQVRETLEQSGLTYAQLQEELLDHLVCDIENYMQQGMNFQSAREKVFAGIPKNQLKNIQTETMEIVNKKPGIVSIMAIMSLLFLIGGTLFKMLHLQGADIMLIAGTASIILTTLVSVYKGFYVSPTKKGGVSVLFLGVLFLIFIISILFQILHWPGANEARLISVIGLCILFPALSVYFYRSRQAAKDHAVILLLEKNQHIIDRILLSLVILGIGFKIPAILHLNSGEFIPFLFPLLAIVLIGLYLFTLTWKAFVTPISKKNETAMRWLLVLSIIASFLYILPAWAGKLSTALTLSFYVLVAVTVCIYYSEYSQDNQRKLLAFFSFLLLCIPLLMMVLNSGLLPDPQFELILNSIYSVPMLIGMIALLIIFYKKTVFRAFMMLMLAHYILIYPVV